MRSLIISPNLDALLEYDERTRARALSTASETTTLTRSSRSRSVSPTEGLPVELPPPPRHPRRVRTRHSTSFQKSSLLFSEDTELQAREMHNANLAPTASIYVQPAASSFTSNPYINPVPTLAELLVDIPAKERAASEPFINSISQSRPYDPEQFLGLASGPSHSRDGSAAPVVFTSPWSPVDDFGGEYSGQQSRPCVPHASLGPYSSCNVDAPIRDTGDHQRQSLESSADSDRNKSWRQPIYSRLKRPPASPNPFSSHEPVMVTTTENGPRTVYSPSPTRSHSHSLYNDPAFSLTESKQSLDLQMEIYSVSQAEFNLDTTSMDCPQLSPIQFSNLSLSPASLKPPLPTTPKPIFYHNPIKPAILRQTLPSRTERSKTGGAALPPTTNFLAAGERADLIRKTRKLARVFGQTPRADAVSAQETSLSALSRYSSMLNDLDWPILRRKRSTSQFESDPSLLSGARRHSLPLCPDNMTNVKRTSQGYLFSSNGQPGHHAQTQIRSANRAGDTLDGDTTFVTPEADKITMSHLSSSPQSHSEKMFDEEQADEERRRRRERLAKLHRFLGSRVPANLVLGTDDVEASLPPLLPSSTSTSDGSKDPQKTWLKRRRSSSAVLPPLRWPNDLERVKEELDEKERLINVRRAVKMEKVFGVAPPQTLYRTRQSSPPLSMASTSTVCSPTASASPVQRNSSAYLKYKPKKNDRSSTSDSSLPLLLKHKQTFDHLASASKTSHSVIYNHYQHSLNSLHDILARDDRESLVELHQYLNEGENSSSQLEMSPVAIGRRMSIASSFKSARRRSLPAMTSMISLDSEYSITTPEADVTTFQVRRRKAAKLTQFFGVDYRELISDILQSIETGLENEHENGTLRAEEAEDLFARLRNLKDKRHNFLSSM